ncbi:MAG TPA: hypothetical protein VGB64_12145 [Actinomycetota bacterium]
MFAGTNRTRRSIVAALILSLATAMFAPRTARAAAGDIFVYSGNGALNEGYSAFAAAAGRTLTVSSALPADLAGLECVILPVNASAFSAAQKTVLSDYVRAGGTLIAIAEHSGFAGAIATMSDLSASLGSAMSVVSDAIDSDFHTTTSIDSDALTDRMTSYVYAAASRVSIAGSARSLIRTQTGGQTFIGAQILGAGTFVLSGDSNGLSDNSHDGYTGPASNPEFAENLCGGSTAILTPVIFLHGIMGAYLKNTGNGEEKWPQAGTTARDLSDDHLNVLRLGPDGRTPLHPENPDYQIGVMGERGIEGIIGEIAACIIICFRADAYQETFDILAGHGYRRGRTLFPFAYDFRKSAAFNADLLLAKIDEVRAQTGKPKVNIIAHSQGGLVTRAMLDTAGSIGKVHRVVTLGTPYLGATQSIGVLDYKEPCKAKEIFGKCTLNRNKAQEVATNWPGFLELLPSRAFHSAFGSPIYSYRDDDGDGARDEWHTPAEVRDTLADRNLALIDQAQAFHDGLDFFAPADSSVELTRIVGTGIPTITQIQFYSKEHCSGYLWWRDCEIRDAWQFAYATGDETVPLNSASLYNRDLGFDFRGGAPNLYSVGVSHGNLVKDRNVMDFVAAYLADPVDAGAPAGSALTSGSVDAEAEPGDGLFDEPAPLSGIEVTVGGAVAGGVTDPAGNVLGLLDPAAGVDASDVPGASLFGGDGEQTYFFTGDDAYTGRWTAAGDGEIALRIRRYDSDSIAETTVTPRVSLSEGAVVTMGFDGSPDLGALSIAVDDDADGAADRTVAFKPPVTGDAAADAIAPATQVTVERFTDEQGRRMARIIALATDEGSGVDRIEYALDATEQQGLYSAPLVVEAKGEVFLRAIDRVGNVEAPYQAITLDDFPGRMRDVREFARPEPVAQVQGFVDYAADVDWIGVDVNGGYHSFVMATPAADFDLALYDEQGSEIWLGNNRGAGPEAVVLNLAAGRYFLRITGAGGAFDEANPYRIVLARLQP